MEHRVAVLAVIVRNAEAVGPLNELLHQHAEHIIGRMGLPYEKRDLRLISVAMDAPQNEISALSGQIGKLSGVTIKTAYAPTET